MVSTAPQPAWILLPATSSHWKVYCRFYVLEKKLIVEVDGSQHYTTEGKEYDQIRDTFLKGHGFHVLRFNSSETLKNIDVVLEKIYEALQ
jgi:very-short-patch-repair endonuclease